MPVCPHLWFYIKVRYKERPTLDIKHLELFAAVARYGSINRAAQELYIS